MPTIWVVIMMIMVALAPAVWVFVGKHRRGEKSGIKSVVVILGLSSFPVVAIFIRLYGHSILVALKETLGLNGMRLVICLMIFALGAGAYLWKRADATTYGLGEILFGIVTTVSITLRITAEQSFLSQWATLGAAAYVIARGLNNIADVKNMSAVGTQAAP